MKRPTFLLFVILLSVNILIAQDENKSIPEFRNEIGLDVTSFVRQFVISPDGYNYDDPNYIIRYRRSFVKGNLRLAIGGRTSSNSSEDNDYEITLKSHNNHFNFKIGWEYREELGKKWEVTYGLDLGPSFLSTENENIYGGEYLTKYSTSAISLSLAPVIGIRFYITERIVLSSEATLNFYWSSREQKIEYSNLPGFSNTLPDNSTTKSSSIGVNYSQPLALIFSFKL